MCNPGQQQAAYIEGSIFAEFRASLNYSPLIPSLPPWDFQLLPLPLATTSPTCFPSAPNSAFSHPFPYLQKPLGNQILHTTITSKAQRCLSPFYRTLSFFFFFYISCPLGQEDREVVFRQDSPQPTATGVRVEGAFRTWVPSLKWSWLSAHEFPLLCRGGVPAWGLGMDLNLTFRTRRGTAD